MTEKMRGFVEGLVLGLSGKPLAADDTDPVAYLYNGVRLPEIPTTEGYPYAMLVDTSVWGSIDGNAIYLYLMPTNNVEVYSITFQHSGTQSFLGAVGKNVKAVFYRFYPNKGYWGEAENQTIYVSDRVNGLNGQIPPFWANFDVPHAYGSVYLASTEPVPVYE